ncbi:MAG TPA: lipopolysaccharide biosynthesis protein [Bryobacteraceae bacterium]|nr:lipopolysaccharide biosynthesis protein [Bryobacteraceae bacterium]
MIVAFAKFGNTVMVGQFSLGLAIATPIIMFTNLQLRSVQATDATREYSFAEYLGLRTGMTLLAMLSIALVILLGNYARGTTKILFAVACAKCLETLSDVIYGLFQSRDRLDQIGKSMILRGVVSVAGLSATLYLTKDAFWSVVVLALTWLLVLLSFDVRRGRGFLGTVGPTSLGAFMERPRYWFQRQWKLIRLSLPLGIVMTLAAFNQSVPRYFIHAHLGERELGIFSALSYTTVSVTLVADALGASATPQLSRLFAAGQMSAFKALMARLAAFGVLLGAGAWIAAKLMGATLLTIFYSSEYAAHSDVFVRLMSAAGISAFAALLTYGITSARSFRIQVPIYLLVVCSNALGCMLWVRDSGLAGAASAVMLASLVQVTAFSAAAGWLFISKAKTILPQSTEYDLTISL